jgi:hypothetical protein
MKTFIIFLILLAMIVGFEAFSQSKKLIEYTGFQELPIKEVPITDGMTYKYSINAPADSATYFVPADDAIYDATVVFKKRVVTPPPADVTEDVDDRDARIVYGAGWDKTCCTTDVNSPHFNKTISWSCTAGNTFTFTFTGKSVTWFVERMLTHGIAGIKFDNETTEARVDLYNPTKLTQQAIFTKNFAVNGEHKVIIRVTGEKNAAATAGCIVTDYFRIIK